MHNIFVSNLLTIKKNQDKDKINIYFKILLDIFVLILILIRDIFILMLDKKIIKKSIYKI